MSQPRQVPITFYTKPGCHLCEDIDDQLEVLAANWPLQITSIDITADLDVHRRYWDKIPVVVVATQTLYAPIDPNELAATVQKAAESD
jgi:hypothetical protein